MEAKLTDKQRFFCREYLRDFNATQAAIRAGYSRKTAGSIGGENLQKPEIQALIKTYAEQLNERTGNDIERIITELQLIAFGGLKDVADWNESGLQVRASDEMDDEARLVSEITESRTVTKDETISTIKVKLYDKLRALDMLGRYHKIFTDKIEHSTEKDFTVNLSYKRGE